MFQFYTYNIKTHKDNIILGKLVLFYDNIIQLQNITKIIGPHKPTGVIESDEKFYAQINSCWSHGMDKKLRVAFGGYS